LRIAWVVKAWATGGAERMLLDLAPFFPDDVEVVAVAARTDPDDLVPAMSAAGINARKLGSPLWPLRLRRLVREERVDIVHFHGPYVGGLGRPALVGTHVRVVDSEHNMWSSYRRPSRALSRLSFGRNDAVIAVSDAVAGELEKSRLPGRERARAIRNGIDVDAVRADAARGVTAPIPESPRYVCVGHLRHRKGVDVLLRASLSVPNARGVVVGDGEDAAHLRALCDELHAPVDLLGNRPDARAITSAAEVFVVPSRTEGTPLALLEAMALERPIVATAVGGIPELLTNDENALLVPPESPAALAAAIGRLLDDRELAARLGAAARETVAREASARATAAAYLAVYRSLRP
jgi:glycosyltransferase involved in cell wall biosynthesis